MCSNFVYEIYKILLRYFVTPLRIVTVHKQKNSWTNEFLATIFCSKLSTIFFNDSFVRLDDPMLRKTFHFSKSRQQVEPIRPIVANILNTARWSMIWQQPEIRLKKWKEDERKNETIGWMMVSLSWCWSWWGGCSNTRTEPHKYWKRYGTIWIFNLFHSSLFSGLDALYKKKRRETEMNFAKKINK